ncbi:hypothetical protein N9917_03235 [Deltaproteobacteria bacterium]|nr:hypothetical protein [Deltaproteobacteria bacterium]
MTTRFTGTAAGWLKPDPKADTIKFRPGWLIVQCDRDWSWLTQKWLAENGHGRWATIVDRDRLNEDGRTVDLTPRLGRVLDFMPPAWGPHISVCRGERIDKSKRSLWKSLRNRELEFTYDPDLRSNGEYFWHQVQCEELLDLREQLGLRREPKQRLHLTVGRVR